MFTPQRPPRGSTTSRSRPALRQVYQELQPTSEWKQEEGSAVLVVHVPGFTKEQVGIQIEGMDRLRVRGTRLSLPNTRIRFDKAFPIPEDCTTSGIQAKFGNGILYVTFQKKTENITQVGSEEKQAKPTQQRDEKDSQLPSPREVSPPSASTSGGEGKREEAPSKLKSEMDEASDLKQTTSTTQGKSQTEAKSTEAPTKLKSPEDEDANLRKASTSSLGDNIGTDANNMETLSSKKAQSNKAKAEKATPDEVRGKTNHDDMEKPTAAEKSEEALGKALDQKQTESSEKISKESKLTAESSAQNALGKAVDQKQTEGSEKLGKESKVTAENVIQKRVGKEKMDGPADSLDQKAATEKYSNATKIGRTTKMVVDGYKSGKYKQIVKDFITPKAEEDRKLLLNMGVAALVIVALGAYMTYTHWPSENLKKQ
ncbi:hypothetical protein CK203_029591 [Vitis vinifera]|uniref:SHSP domain-containing protein n=1 Tax=Vitis vinifera TaxID=29760 RepID=A0A438JCF2_VITVI|nr:hypothetical protein CK203_029591 [Vitis vinifera]